MEEAFRQIKERIGKMRERDPFRDIPQDHVLVVHPHHRQLMDEMLRSFPFPSMPYDYSRLSGGRRVVFESRALQTHFHFMSLAQYYELFPYIELLSKEEEA